jgi:uncharacterized membrane protein (UPF0182 family)
VYVTRTNTTGTGTRGTASSWQYGNLLTLPIAQGGVLYVEPLFTERISATPNGSTFPQPARVLVGYRDPATAGVASASVTHRPSPRR